MPSALRDDGQGSSLAGHATIAVEAEHRALLGLVDGRLLARDAAAARPLLPVFEDEDRPALEAVSATLECKTQKHKSPIPKARSPSPHGFAHASENGPDTMENPGPSSSCTDSISFAPYNADTASIKMCEAGSPHAGGKKGRSGGKNAPRPLATEAGGAAFFPFATMAPPDGCADLRRHAGAFRLAARTGSNAARRAVRAAVPLQPVVRPVAGPASINSPE